MLAVGVATLMVPVLLALLVFPSTMVDTRELFAWGPFYPLTMLKHPPLAAWIAGAVETVLPANAFSAILAGQILNAVGFVYFYALLRPIIGRNFAPFWTFLFATSLYFMLAPLSYALNNDILQVPAWLAILYHFLRGAKTNAWRHWIALGLWAAAAVLIKYSAGILFFAGIVATIAVPEYRRVWRNPRLLLAIVIGTLCVLPHLIALRTDSAAIAYAESFAAMTPTFLGRLNNIGYFIVGTGFFLLNAWLIVAGGFLNGNCRAQGLPADPEARAETLFIIALTLTALAATFALALLTGALLNHRYGAPYFGLFLLSVAPLVSFRMETFAAAERSVTLITALVAAAVFIGSAVVYVFFTSHNYMQEPIDEAAAAMRADWDSRYSCGPGYALGDRSTAHGVATYGDRHPWGVPVSDVGRPVWWDAERLQREGAIVAYRGPIPAAEVEAHLPGIDLSGERSVTLPLLRSRTGDTLTYHYVFIPPADCAIAPR